MVIIRCLHCGKKIPDELAIEIDQRGIEPFCNSYCNNMYSGVPLPYSHFNPTNKKPDDLEVKRGQDMVKEDKQLQIKYQRHMDICKELNKLYITKNKEYGDSFGKAVDDLGVYSATVQMYHKLQRIINLTNPYGEKRELEYESLEDNLKDLANYAILTLLEIEGRN